MSQLSLHTDLSTEEGGNPAARLSIPRAAAQDRPPAKSQDLMAAIADGTDPYPMFAEVLTVQRVLDAVERSSANDSSWTRAATQSPAPV